MGAKEYGKLIAKSAGFEHSEANLGSYFVHKAHNHHLYIDSKQ